MLLGQIITASIVAIGLITAYFICKAKKIEISNLVFKIVSGVLALTFFVRYMLGEEAMDDVYKLTSMTEPYLVPLNLSAFMMAMGFIAFWLLLAANLLIILYPFFKNSKYTALVKYFGLFTAILCLAFIYPLTIGVSGNNAYAGFDTRALLLGVEIGIVLGYSLVVFLSNGYFKVEKKDLWFLGYIPFMILATFPTFTFDLLVGHANYSIKLEGFTTPHRLILYGNIIIPFALYFLLRHKDKETKRGILLFITLGTLITFMNRWRFVDFLDVTNWPFHLCHTAMFLIPLCLIFKLEKLFYFTYFINVFGALMAMAMPNTSETANILEQSIVLFYTNHYIAFFMPILIVGLNVYDRPTLKQFKYSMAGFAMYFILVLIMNAWFSNYGEVDYFYINSDFIADKFGKWAENLRLLTVSFNIGKLNFLFYPLYQSLYFVVYGIIAAAVWFVYEAGFSFTETLADIKQRKQIIKADQLALEVALGGRGKEEPMNMEGTNKIILRNFSKRYGKSDVYAVKDANLEICGGEIFGFLGHNGAGKSTIIKSIVGIQPITSGSIEVCGYDVDKQPVMAKRQIGFVPDHYALYEKLTGREYLNYIADLYDVSKEDREASINKYVELFELQGAIDNQIKTYSHGMKQKVTIMSALVHNPKVWILDEPLTGLDPTSIFQVKECMREHAKKGNIVFFSSHLIDIVEQLCDRIAIIKKGKILSCEKVDDIMAREDGDLEDYYLRISSKRVQAASAIKEDKKEQAEKEETTEEKAEA